MEKKLRACRVSIIPKNGGYLDLPPVSKKPAEPTISPEAVKKATNPIALRYWNQCSNREITTDVRKPTSLVADSPPWVTEPLSSPIGIAEQRPMVPPKAVKVPNITKRMGRAGSEGHHQSQSYRSREQSMDRLTTTITFSAHDDPSPMGSPRPEVVKVLSTAGSGMVRDNEKKEAVGNINRLITVAMTKKEEGEIPAQEKTKKWSVQPNGCYEESRNYNTIKEEQIEISQQRANFLGGSEMIRIPKSPRPFHEVKHGMEESQQKCSCNNTSSQFASKEIPFNTISDLLPKLNQQQTTNLGLRLFSQMSQDTVMEVTAQQLSVMSGSQMAAVLATLPSEAINTAIPLLFHKTDQDVRMSLLIDTLARLSVDQKVDSLLESEQQIPDVVQGLLQRLSYEERGFVIKSILEREENPITPRRNPNVGDRIIPEIRLETSEDERDDRNGENEETRYSEREGLSHIHSDDGSVSN